MTDYVSIAVSEWAAERPELDTRPMEVVSRLLRAGKIIENRLDEIAAGAGLSHKGELDVLTALRRIGPPYQQTPSWLARSVQLTTGGMTNRLDRLAKAGFVERHPDPDDRRGVLVRLTAAGVGLADQAFERLLQAQADMVAAIDPVDRDAIATTLAGLLDNLGDTSPHRATT